MADNKRSLFISLSVLIFGCYIGMFDGIGGGIIISLAPILYTLMTGGKDAQKIIPARSAFTIMCLAGLVLMALSLTQVWNALGNPAVMLFVGSGIYSAFVTLSSFRIPERGGK